MEYTHGGDVYSQAVRLDFSANINPFGTPKSVLLAAAKSLSESSRYPDSKSRELCAALGVRHGVLPEWIRCGNGAADLIFSLAFSRRPRRALVTAPTFSEYEQALTAVGCEVTHFFLEEACGFLPDVEAMGRAVAGQDLVFLCNPNNPTGAAILQEDVLRLAEHCKNQGAILVVDECFCEFLEDEARYSVIPYLETFPNLFVLRAFTKIYAMAGLRLGYALCANLDVLEGIECARQPWSVSNVAQAAGLAALKEQKYVRESVAYLSGERVWLSRELAALGFCVYQSGANYVMFRDPAGEHLLYENLLQQGILVRSCANYPGLDGSYYRVCVRLRAENEELLGALYAYQRGERR